MVETRVDMSASSKAEKWVKWKVDQWVENWASMTADSWVALMVVLKAGSLALL